MPLPVKVSVPQVHFGDSTTAAGNQHGVLRRYDGTDGWLMPCSNWLSCRCLCEQVESYKPNASVFHTMRENLYYNTMHTFKNDMVGVHGIGNEFRSG